MTPIDPHQHSDPRLRNRPAARDGAAVLAVIAFGCLIAGCDRDVDYAGVETAGDIANGRQVVADLGCGACHTIPGIAGARGTVGPSLDGFARRNFIAGVLPNRLPELAEFVRNAAAIVPETAMPPMPLTEEEAIDVGAFLLTLE